MQPDLGDLSDLPEELLRELRATRMDELDDRIVAILNDSDSALNIDQILIGLYRKFSAIHSRAFLLNKLYRLARKGPIDHAGNGTYARPGLRKARGEP